MFTLPHPLPRLHQLQRHHRDQHKPASLKEHRPGGCRRAPQSPPRASDAPISTVKSPAFCAATLCSSGIMRLHGPHHVAKKSTRTGPRASPSMRLNSSSEATSRRLAGGGPDTAGVLVRPASNTLPAIRFWPASVPICPAISSLSYMHLHAQLHVLAPNLL